MNVTERDALLMVDVQNDFLPGGALGVTDGDQIIEPITALARQFKVRVGTMDWHPIHHCSFEKQGGPWPQHCVNNSTGAYQHQKIVDAQNALVLKGTDATKEAYSGFEGRMWSGSGGDLTDETLADYLRRWGIERVFVVGLALDFCVKATAIDAVAKGFATVVLTDCTRAVFPEHDEATAAELREAGALVTTARFLDDLDEFLGVEKETLDRPA